MACLSSRTTLLPKPHHPCFENLHPQAGLVIKLLWSQARLGDKHAPFHYRFNRAAVVVKGDVSTFVQDAVDRVLQPDQVVVAAVIRGTSANGERHVIEWVSR